MLIPNARFKLDPTRSSTNTRSGPGSGQAHPLDRGRAGDADAEAQAQNAQMAETAAKLGKPIKDVTDAAALAAPDPDHPPDPSRGSQSTNPGETQCPKDRTLRPNSRACDDDRPTPLERLAGAHARIMTPAGDDASGGDGGGDERLRRWRC
jgi:hypothetical protein